MVVIFLEFNVVLLWKVSVSVSKPLIVCMLLNSPHIVSTHPVLQRISARYPGNFKVSLNISRPIIVDRIIKTRCTIAAELAIGIISIFAKTARLAMHHVTHITESFGQHFRGILGKVFFMDEVNCENSN